MDIVALTMEFNETFICICIKCVLCIKGVLIIYPKLGTYSLQRVHRHFRGMFIFILWSDIFKYLLFLIA